MRVLLRGSSAAIITGAAVFTMATAATAQEAPALSVTIDTVTRGEPGSTHLLAARDDAGLSGQTCDVVVEGDNNSSVHPGNDLIVTTTIDGEPSDLVVVPDFERATDAVTEGRSRLTVGETLTLLVRLGTDVRPDGLVTSSGGATVQLVDCTAPEVPPTTPTTTVVTTPPPSIGPPLPPVTAPPATPTTLPHTGASPWLAIIGAIVLFSGVVSVATGKAIKRTGTR